MTAELFANSVMKAVSRDLSIASLLDAVEKLSRSGEIELVMELYSVWIKHNKTHPLLYAMYFNYGVTLSDARDLQGAREALTESIRLNPNFWPPYINLGTLLERMGDAQGAVNQWTQVVNALPAITGDGIFHKLTALKQIGRVLETGRLETNAEEVLRMSLDINPEQRDVVQHWVALRQTQCKWPIFAPWERVTRKTLMRGISPLSLAALSDDPMFQLGTAHRYHGCDVMNDDTMFTAGSWSPPDRQCARRLRIGYLSSDLRQHAVGFLTAGMYELHNREKVEVFVYYCGIHSPDIVQQRIKSSVDHWIEISDLSDKAAAKRIIDDEIDILVDLNGYTKDARPKMLALRPAPVIVNWLGYPGTMGSTYHNYIIADDHIIPRGAEIYYSEKVMRVPCYQPNDRQRIIAPRLPARAEAGLPEDAVVFCSFNGLQKITRFTFMRWMTILRNVPKSVAWIMGGTDAANLHLRQLAEEQGVAGTRLVFVEKKPNPEHMARYTLADLFLDTSPYGAHTTASDALWMGVPVLTVPGRSFAARVCASLLHAADMAEFVCSTPEAYVQRAIELGNNPERLRSYKQFLLENRDRCLLFDTARLVKSLEDVYEQMWAEYTSGHLPEPDLTNLDIYQQIGCEIDHEATELAAIPDYAHFYRKRLEQRHAFHPIGPDNRLWPEEMARKGASSGMSSSRPTENVLWQAMRSGDGHRQARI